MATHQLAKGLASLGRNGDSMLVHMTPSEVDGLKAIGSMTGRKVTTNPHTGMPEAFSLGDFFSSLIPTGIGFLLGGPAGAAMGFEKGSMMAPVIGGMAAGAAVAGAKGEDPLMGGIMGGLGGYGGGNLAGTFEKMGANAALKAAPNLADVTTQAGGYSTPAMEEALKKGVSGPMLPNAQLANTNLLQPGTYSPALSQAIPSATVATTPTAGENIMAGLKQFGSDPFGKGYEAFKGAGGTGMQLAMPLGMAGLAGAQEDLYPEPDMSMEEKRKAEENKYRDPRTGLLNLAQSSPGLKLMATGGSVGTNTSTISTGGIQDLYGSNDQTTGATGTTSLSQDGYGIGRLNALAAEGSRAKAADTFYAAGGPVSFADGGMAPGSDMPLAIPESQLRYMRGPTRSYSGARMGPSYSSGTGGNLMSDYFSTWQRSFPGFAAPSLNNPRSYFGGPGSRIGGMRFSNGGIASFAQGGQNYLDGQGDGMSDSIPATIEGKQPARLADGEFVIPADVVSHLGNGSSKAGAKRLYSMLHKVRKARTGNPKQGKEINPNKYMPA